MTFNDYQKQALATVLPTGDEFLDLMHFILGLSGEAAEVGEKMKKIIRDKQAKIGDLEKQELAKEVGDVLWYIAVLADALGYTMEELAEQNLAKLQSRKRRDVLSGSGDNR